MYVERQAVTIITDASGAGTGYTTPVTGRVLGITYAKTDYADGVDVVVSTETTAQTILTLTDQNSSAVFYPRSVVHGNTGSALTGVEAIPVAAERIKITVAAGGNTKTGTFYVLVG